MEHSAIEATSTKQRLAAALEDAGLHPQIVGAAVDGYFDELESPLTAPIAVLAKEMRDQGFPKLAKRAERGEWNATDTEREAWQAAHGNKTGAEVWTEKMRRP